MRFGPDWQDNDLIFCREDGTPYRPDSVTRRFKTLSKAAGLPEIRLHDARHSATSAMRAAGIDPELRMKVTGHSSRDVHDRYTHFWDDSLTKAAGDAEKLVTGS